MGWMLAMKPSSTSESGWTCPIMTCAPEAVDSDATHRKSVAGHDRKTHTHSLPQLNGNTTRDVLMSCGWKSMACACCDRFVKKRVMRVFDHI